MIASKADEYNYNNEIDSMLDLPDEPMNDEPEQEEETAQIIRTVKPKDKSMSFVTAQIVLCSFALIFLLILKMAGGEYYRYSKYMFGEYFNKPINKSQVLGADDAKAVIAAQSTVYGYGVGGESADNSIRHITEKKELTDKQSKALSAVNKMRLPTDSHTVTCEYGERIHPITGKKSFHTGVDIGEDEGENIYSVLDGTVKSVMGNDSDYGNYCVIMHTNGVETMYAHASKLLVKKGQKVKKGEVIAKVGTTGMSTGPHLHFEVRVNDTRLNPRWFINL